MAIGGALTASPVPPAAEPAIPTICSVEMFAATIEIPINGHVRLRPPRKKSDELCSVPSARRLFHTESPITQTKNRTKEMRESVCTGLGQKE